MWLGEIMKTMGTAAALLTLAAAPPALAQELDLGAAPLPAPRRAFEVSVDLGWTQGFGSLRDGRAVGDVAGAGAALGLGLGYRAIPYVSVAATAMALGFDASSTLPQGTMVRGLAAGLEATFHVSPHRRVDPWVSLGGGYRALWEVPEGTAPTTLTHGLSLGRLAIGLDVRPSESFAVAPMIGADLDMFMWRKSSGAEAGRLEGGGVSAFLFAGLRGRFDIGGTRVPAGERLGTSATGSR
jgi:hypothetical protein